MLSTDFLQIFPKFLRRIFENWTFINVLFYKPVLTFFEEIFLGMIELFHLLSIKSLLLKCRGVDILISNYAPTKSHKYNKMVSKRTNQM